MYVRGQPEDYSIVPAMVWANTNGPIMAAAWRGSELILELRNC